MSIQFIKFNPNNLIVLIQIICSHFLSNLDIVQFSIYLIYLIHLFLLTKQFILIIIYYHHNFIFEQI